MTKQNNIYYGVVDRKLLKNNIRNVVKSNTVEVANTVVMKRSLIMKADAPEQILKDIVSYARKNMIKHIKEGYKEYARNFDMIYACVQCEDINEFHTKITRVYSTEELDDATGHVLVLM